ncbi:hypothetical protein ACVNIS_06430 [Sphaerotilaceae bacterium SBD11-9]
MAAVAESRAITGNGLQSQTLSRTGRVETAPGVTLHRPCPDLERKPEPEPSGYLNRAELAALKAAFKPLAACEKRLAEIDTESRETRYSDKPAKRHLLAQLEDERNTLNADHDKLRGAARVAFLAALEAAAIRAGTKYRRACAMLADEAAELEGLARLRDDLLGKAMFDPLSIWQRSNCLQAPPLGYRPRGWMTVPDVYGVEHYWHADSVPHAEAKRRVQQAFRDQTAEAQAGAVFPF